jgi:hypothetical protein
MVMAKGTLMRARFALIGASVVALLALLFAPAVRAADPSVTAVLTDSETVVGRPVQLQIEIAGSSSPKPPAEITVDGLDIRSAGTSGRSR